MQLQIVLDPLQGFHNPERHILALVVILVLCHYISLLEVTSAHKSNHFNLYEARKQLSAKYLEHQKWTNLRLPREAAA